MFENLIAKIYRYQLQRKAKAQRKGQDYKKEKERAEMYNFLKLTYQFVRWLNTKGLGNRHARKIFWKRVINGEQIEEKVLLNLLEKFSKKEVESIKVSKVENKSCECKQCYTHQAEALPDTKKKEKINA